MDEFETDLRVYHGLRIFAKGYRPFLETKMQSAFGGSWAQRASLADGADKSKPLDSYALLKTTLDRWSDVFRVHFGGGRGPWARVCLVFEARNKLAHEESITAADAVGFLNAMIFMLEAAGAHDLLTTMKGLVEALMRPPNPPSGPTGTIRERVLSAIRKWPDRDDRELARLAEVPNPTSVNIVCNQ